MAGRSTALRGYLRLAALSLAVPAASPAAAQSPPLPNEPSAANGHQISQRLCVGCHVIDATSPATAPATGVPTFRAIANRAGQTGSHIKDRLIAPPHQMPDMTLTLREIDDILAYLQTLRTVPGPNFLPDTGGAKPAVPKPS